MAKQLLSHMRHALGHTSHNYIDKLKSYVQHAVLFYLFVIFEKQLQLQSYVE